LEKIDDLKIINCCQIAENLGHCYLFYHSPNIKNAEYFFSDLKSEHLNNFTFHFHPFQISDNFEALKINDFQDFDVYYSNNISLINTLEKTYYFNGNQSFDLFKIDKKNYIEQAEFFINSFDENFKKAILSRIVIAEKNDFNPKKLFDSLCEKYPDAFTYIFYHPKSGFWCGASPETLVKSNHEIVETVSLAGSMVYDDKNDFNWGEKEIQEQQIVTDYILEKLKNVGIKNIQTSKPYTVKAGKLAHIKTDIKAEISGITFSEIANSLHPTPAIAGLPKDKALQLINQTEKHKRAYYCGYLGIENKAKNENHFWVNLRCMQLINDKFAIYVGGGLTKNSIAEKEWEETTLKSSTMLEVLKKI
jgi:isochorismate synthase